VKEKQEDAISTFGQTDYYYSSIDTPYYFQFYWSEKSQHFTVVIVNDAFEREVDRERNFPNNRPL
jgi:hypothetical protein